MSGRFSPLAVILACLCALPASATVIFDGTGSDFFEDPLTVFPTVAPSIDGSALDFLVDPDDQNRVLAMYPLAPAGSFSAAGGTLVVTITTNLTRASEDFDPVFMVMDGSAAVGGQVGDNPNGSARAIGGSVSGDTLAASSDPLIFTDAGFVAIGEALDAAVMAALGTSSSELRVSFLGSSATANVATIIDVEGLLSFVLVANSFISPEERYRVNTLRLEIEQVPETDVPLLMLTALLALVTHRILGKRSACA
jgi:hypothetical protein